MKKKNPLEVLQTSALIQGAAKKFAGHQVQRMLGFWMMWHAWGGREALIESGVLSRSNVYLQRALFSAIFNVDVDDFLPEYGRKIRGEEK